jgi:uncharacterized protein YybS (DUF2232 family)
MLLQYIVQDFLNNFEMVPVALIIVGITFAFISQIHSIYIVRSLYFRIYSAFSLSHSFLLNLQHVVTYTSLSHYCGL